MVEFAFVLNKHASDWAVLSKTLSKLIVQLEHILLAGNLAEAEGWITLRSI